MEENTKLNDFNDFKTWQSLDPTMDYLCHMSLACIVHFFSPAKGDKNRQENRVTVSIVTGCNLDLHQCWSVITDSVCLANYLMRIDLT